LGFDKTEISEIESINYIKRLLRAFNLFSKLYANVPFMNIFNKIRRIKIYELKMSEDYNEIIHRFNEFIDYII